MKIEELIPKIIQAALNNDRRTIEELSIMIIKKLKKTDPEIAAEISSLISIPNFSSNMRSHAANIPLDRETHFSLVKKRELFEVQAPTLSKETMDELCDFIAERKNIDKLIIGGISPPSSILLLGPPGVGKSHSAEWISNKLELPLITIDLATSMSSYLGRSGQNIKTIFDYSRATPSVLFIDELDAIAKKRDDQSDMGELKRLVNILLKEMEDWPIHSIILAATNHPDLLDHAIWRRFDRVVNFTLPSKTERKIMIENGLESIIDKIDSQSLNIVIEQSEGLSGADLERINMQIRRNLMIKEESNPNRTLLEIYYKNIDVTDKRAKILLCQTIKKAIPDISCREITQITKIPYATVSRYLKEAIE